MRSRRRCRCTRRTRTAPVSRTSCSPRCRPSSPSISSAVWEAPLRAAGADRADVFHLHHLTPQLDAAHRYWPHVPLVVHLHGTELKMIEAIAAARRARGRPRRDARDHARSAPGSPASACDLDAAQVEMLRTTRWDSWRHGEFWAARLKQQAQLADHLIAVSPQNREAAISMLGIEPDRRHRAPERRGHRALPAAAAHARCPPGRVPALARRGPAGLDRVRPAGNAGVHRSRPRPAARRGRRRHRAALRRAVPRVQARARVDPRVRRAPAAGSHDRARS